MCTMGACFRVVKGLVQEPLKFSNLSKFAWSRMVMYQCTPMTVKFGMIEEVMGLL